MVSSETIEAEATPIDPPEVISGAARWVSEQRERVGRIAEEFRPHEITSAKDYRDSKRARTLARNAIKEVDDAKRAQTKALKDAVSAFEADVRDLLAPLKGIDEAYRSALSSYEEMVIDSRTQDVEAWYLETQGDMAAMVPFKAIWDRFSAEGKWGNYGANAEAIKADVYERVGAIERDWATIDSSPYSDEEKAAIKASYCKSLDLSAAMREAQEERERRDRIAQVEAERRRRAEEAERAMREAQEARERREAEEAQARAEAEERDRRERLAEAEEALQRRVATGQEPPAPPMAPPMAPPAPESVCAVALMPSLTADAIRAARQALASAGVEASVIALTPETYASVTTHIECLRSANERR